MTDVTKIDQVQQGLDDLPSQWGAKYDVNNIDYQHPPTKVQQLLASWLHHYQEAEDLLNDISESYNLYTAIGVQLDVLGDFRGVYREGRNDTQYRQAIITSISASSGSGTIGDVTNLLSALTGSSKQTLWEHYPLGYVLYTNSSPFYLIPTDMSPASVGGVDGRHVIFDENEDSFAPSDLVVTTELLVDDEGDFIVDDVGDNIELTVFAESNDIFGRSSFPDSSDPEGFRPLPVIGGLDYEAVDGVGYGAGYGESYGGTP